MTPRQTALALLATLAALIWGGIDRILYEFDSLSEGWQIFWVFVTALLIMSVAAWVLHPFVKLLM